MFRIVAKIEYYADILKAVQTFALFENCQLDLFVAYPVDETVSKLHSWKESSRKTNYHKLNKILDLRPQIFSIKLPH